MKRMRLSVWSGSSRSLSRDLTLREAGIVNDLLAVLGVTWHGGVDDNTLRVVEVAGYPRTIIREAITQPSERA
jgi:hypothetical protein